MKIQGWTSNAYDWVKEANLKGAWLFDSNYVAFFVLEKEKWWKQWEGDLCQGLEGGVYRWSIGDFGGSELYLYGMIVVDVGHHTFFGFTECTAPRVTLNVNCGLWLIMMRQCHFISFATLAWCCWWDRVVWNSLYSLLSLTVKLKLV